MILSKKQVSRLRRQRRIIVNANKLLYDTVLYL